jgi:hypothetical protein
MTTNEIIWIVIAAVIGLLMLLDPKVHVFGIIREQIKVFRNHREDENGVDRSRFSFLDLASFVVLPLSLGFIVVYALGDTISQPLAEILITVFSVLFGLLLGFTTLLIGRKPDLERLVKLVVKETLITILSTMLVSLLVTVLLAVIATGVLNTLWLGILSAISLGLSFMALMFLLMLVKRIYVVFSEDAKNKN